MKTRQLGTHGPVVSLGCFAFHDTAEGYGSHVEERLIGEALEPVCDRVALGRSPVSSVSIESTAFADA